jgi:hypothetical protein
MAVHRRLAEGGWSWRCNPPLCSAASHESAEERGRSLELVAVMTVMKMTVPDKREGAVERREKRGKEIPALGGSQDQTTQDIAPPS